MTFRMATVTLIEHILSKNCQLFEVRVAPPSTTATITTIVAQGRTTIISQTKTNCNRYFELTLHFEITQKSVLLSGNWH